VNLPASETFRFCPRCGTNATEGADPRRFLCTECDHCFYFNPACAVAAIIHDESGRILFIRRKREPSKGKLSLPGGFVDPGENAESALVRETKEEVNLDIAAARFLCSSPNHYEYRGVTYPVTDFFFVASVESFQPLSPQQSEVDGIHFLPLTSETISQLAFPSLSYALQHPDFQHQGLQ
jgi:NAD+ diphosphatase